MKEHVVEIGRAKWKKVKSQIICSECDQGAVYQVELHGRPAYVCAECDTVWLNPGLGYPADFLPDYLDRIGCDSNTFRKAPKNFKWHK